MSYASDALIDALKRENKHLCDDNAKLRHMLDECCEGLLCGHRQLSYRISHARAGNRGERMSTLTYERAKQLYAPYDADQMRHLCALRDIEIERLRDENAKLRELLQDYHRYEHEDCYSCRYINECRADESGRCIAPMRLGERYRELGIEVDDVQQRDV